MDLVFVAGRIVSRDCANSNNFCSNYTAIASGLPGLYQNLKCFYCTTDKCNIQDVSAGLPLNTNDILIKLSIIASFITIFYLN